MSIGWLTHSARCWTSGWIIGAERLAHGAARVTVVSVFGAGDNVHGLRTRRRWPSAGRARISLSALGGGEGQGEVGNAPGIETSSQAVGALGRSRYAVRHRWHQSLPRPDPSAPEAGGGVDTVRLRHGLPGRGTTPAASRARRSAWTRSELHPHGPWAVDQGNGGIVAAGEVLGQVADRAEVMHTVWMSRVVDGTG